MEAEIDRKIKGEKGRSKEKKCKKKRTNKGKKK